MKIYKNSTIKPKISYGYSGYFIKLVNKIIDLGEKNEFIREEL